MDNSAGKNETNEFRDKKEGNKYDKILKENILQIIPSLFKTVLRKENYRLEPLPQVKLQTTVEKEPDFLQRIFDDRSPDGRLLHMEFEGQDTEEADFRMKEYNGIAARIYKSKIEQHLLYYGEGVPKRIKGELEDEFFTFRYQVHAVSNISYKSFLYADIPQVVVFAIWANPEGTEPKKLVRLIVEQLREKLGDTVQLKKFIRQLLILAQKRNLHSQTLEVMKEIVDEVQDTELDVFYIVGLEKGWEKGLEKGMEQGLEKGLEQGLEQGLEKGLEKGLEQGLEKGLEKGLEQGLEKGLEEGKIIGIRNMLRKGFVLEDICSILEVTEAFVATIQKQLKKTSKIQELLREKHSTEEIAKKLKIRHALVLLVQRENT
jgi:hypothetical protein